MRLLPKDPAAAAATGTADGHSPAGRTGGAGGQQRGDAAGAKNSFDQPSSLLPGLNSSDDEHVRRGGGGRRARHGGGKDGSKQRRGGGTKSAAEAKNDDDDADDDNAPLPPPEINHATHRSLRNPMGYTNPKTIIDRLRRRVYEADPTLEDQGSDPADCRRLTRVGSRESLHGGGGGGGGADGGGSASGRSASRSRGGGGGAADTSGGSAGFSVPKRASTTARSASRSSCCIGGGGLSGRGAGSPGRHGGIFNEATSQVGGLGGLEGAADTSTLYGGSQSSCADASGVVQVPLAAMQSAALTSKRQVNPLRHRASGHYIKHKLLGRGSYGETWLVEYLPQRQAVVKSTVLSTAVSQVAALQPPSRRIGESGSRSTNLLGGDDAARTPPALLCSNSDSAPLKSPSFSQSGSAHSGAAGSSAGSESQPRVSISTAPPVGAAAAAAAATGNNSHASAFTRSSDAMKKTSSLLGVSGDNFGSGRSSSVVNNNNNNNNNDDGSKTPTAFDILLTDQRLLPLPSLGVYAPNDAVSQVAAAALASSGSPNGRRSGSPEQPERRHGSKQRGGGGGAVYRGRSGGRDDGGGGGGEGGVDSSSLKRNGRGGHRSSRKPVSDPIQEAQAALRNGSPTTKNDHHHHHHHGSRHGAERSNSSNSNSDSLSSGAQRELSSSESTSRTLSTDSKAGVDNVTINRVATPPAHEHSSSSGVPEVGSSSSDNKQQGRQPARAVRSDSFLVHDSAGNIHYHGGVPLWPDNISMIIDRLSPSDVRWQPMPGPGDVSALASTRRVIRLSSGTEIPADRVYVCKTILRNPSSGSMRATIDEINVLASCAHPCILAFIEAFVQDDRLHCITEYMDFGDLELELRKRRSHMRHFSESTVLFLFCQLCLALEYLHRHNILHRDIKTANVLLSRLWLVKLCDFGFAKQSTVDVDVNVSQSRLGTPYYMAPELWNGQQYSAKADMWSLGVLFYELLTLQTPFASKSYPELQRAVMRGDFRPILRDGVSSETVAIVRALLTVDPEKRATAKEILQMPILVDTLTQFLKKFERASSASSSPIDQQWYSVLREHTALVMEDPGRTSTKSRQYKHLSRLDAERFAFCSERLSSCGGGSFAGDWRGGSSAGGGGRSPSYYSSNGSREIGQRPMSVSAVSEGTASSSSQSSPKKTGGGGGELSGFGSTSGDEFSVTTTTTTSSSSEEGTPKIDRNGQFAAEAQEAVGRAGNDAKLDGDDDVEDDLQFRS